ncbi:MAG: reductive dehalogenase domain-containing protein [Acidobacteriota bacterium]
MDSLNIIFLFLSAGFFVLLSAYSIYEKEFRAALVALIFLSAISVFWAALTIWNSLPVIYNFNFVILLLLPVFIVISCIRFFPGKKETSKENIEQFDERDHMFSRMGMQKFPDNSEQYYRDHPDKKVSDKRTAKDPNLGEPGAIFYSRLFSPMADSAFTILDRTSAARTGPVNDSKQETDPVELTRAVSWMAHYYGAVDIGITEIKQYHKYSHHGRKTENWGDLVKNNHKYGIVIVVEMDQEMIKQSPSLPVLLESSKQYVESAKTAHLIAEYIREQGYDALSHVDGNYDVLAVPMAEDAGLGETGRMGILIHRKLGPSVRLSVITTDMPLVVSETRNEHIEEFCSICKKCAENCPTGSVSAEAKPFSRNFEHWSADQDKCYSYWRKAGTDCGFCIRVCPYTKKDTLIHRIIRTYISRNPVNQRIALMMDDLFYGRKFSLKNRGQQEKIFNRI